MSLTEPKEITGQPSTLPSKNLVVITGASGGIGSVTAALFCSLGYRVFGIDQFSLDEAIVRHTLAGSHPAVASGLYTHLVADLLNPEEVERAFKTISEHGLIQYVILLAGGTHPDEVYTNDISKIPFSSVQWSIAINLAAQINLAQVALPYLRQTRDASLIFTSSTNAITGEGLHIYSAAKAGLISLARTLAVSEGLNGVRVNAVIPGDIQTPSTTVEWQEDPKHFDRMRETTATATLTKATDIADTFAALALNLKAITGQSIIVDQGQTAKWR